MDAGAHNVLLELDARRRVSLGTLAKHNRYLAAVTADGTITLTPAVVLPLNAAKDIEAFLSNPETGVQRTRPGTPGEDS